MNPRIQEIIQNAEFITTDDTYYLVGLPANAITVAAGILAEIGEPFSALIVDKDEVTLLIEAEAYEEYKTRLRNHKVEAKTYSLITVDAELESTLTGFMGVISTHLGNVGVPVFPYAAFTRDHILVPTDMLPVALETLNELKQSLK